MGARRKDGPLEGSEELFRSFFDEAPIGKAVADPGGAILRANATLAAMLGYTVEELEAASFLALAHPDDLATIAETVRVVLGGEQRAPTLELRARGKDGRYVWVEVTVGLQRDSAGNPLHLLAHVVDISARKRSEIDLRASETRYRRLFESAKDGILIVAADSGRILDVNPFMTELTGYSREDYLGKHLWEIGPFKDTAASKLAFLDLKVDAYARYDDLPLATRDGRKVDVEFVSNVYLINDEKVIQCNIRDITLRRREELERARLTAAIEQADEAVIITDRHGAIVYVNPAFERVTGYSKSEARGQSPRLLKSGVQDEAFYRSLWATISGGHTWRGRLVNRRKDGRLFSEDATISPVRDASGAITSYVAVKRDLTSALALEAKFLHAQKMEAVGRLAGGVAHDFNNVLSVILSYAEIIGGNLEPNQPLREDIEEIRTAALRAADLTRQLLAFSRQQVLEPKVLNVNDSLSRMQKMLERLLGADVEVTLILASEIGNVRADPGQIEQIVMNLTVNARDAMPHGGKLTIETANVELDEDYARAHVDVRAGSYVEIAVSDTGSGMDRETQARIFEPFFTTKEQGRGTGLGLATVFGIVRQSGGHILVYSEPDQGTTFKIYLPRVGATAEPRRASERAAEAVRGTATILLTEDDDQVRVLARGILRRQGYVVLDASNGGEALLICEQHKGNIDLLLTDVVLPRMSGRQLAERLAPIRPKMKVLYISGYTDDAILQHGIIDSGVAFLQKPLTPASLTRKVREVLGGASGR